MTVQLDRNQALNAVTDNNNPSLPSVRKYQIKANVVNVYHSLGPNDPKFGQSFAENPIQFDESLTFETIKPISIPYSEVD